jgi:DNA-directed RNA polymerase specialized sigma24 family protein
VEQADAARHVTDGLAPIAPDVRVAIELLVIERMAAADIARVLGWPNAKAVYNRVYRALDSVRAKLERAGIRRQDL